MLKKKLLQKFIVEALMIILKLRFDNEKEFVVNVEHISKFHIKSNPLIFN